MVAGSWRSLSYEEGREGGGSAFLVLQTWGSHSSWLWPVFESDFTAPALLALPCPWPRPNGLGSGTT